jgi:Rieske Fe-S protein
VTSPKFTRRELAKGALALTILPACGPVAGALAPAPDGGTACTTEHGTSEEGWVAIPVADHPEVLVVGGSSVVHDSASLLQAILLQPTEGCFKAVWEICPHGSCEVAWQEEHDWLECPCHGSRFGEDGALIRGPATKALPAFPVVRNGDTFWLKRR